MGIKRNFRKSITHPSTTGESFYPKIIYFYGYNLKLKKICLKQKTVSLLHKNIAGLYITYKLDKWSQDLNTEFIQGNSLFGALKLTKNAAMA